MILCTNVAKVKITNYKWQITNYRVASVQNEKALAERPQGRDDNA